MTMIMSASCLCHSCTHIMNHEHFHIHDCSMIVFSLTGAIKRRVEDPPTQGSTPPDDDDPIHPDQHVGVHPMMMTC